jgi:hypothetical protein
MSQWFRVFGTNDAQPVPGALLEHLHERDLPVRGHFRGDDQGWFQAELVLPGATASVQLERFLATEDGIRDELNTWAAWLETAGDNPHHGRLMQHMVSTTQMFTLFRSEDQGAATLLQQVCINVCQYLACATAGVYQVDNQGFFTPEGELLLQEWEGT